MIEIDWSRCKTTPKQHQKDGVLALLKRPHFMLAHQVGAGKSKIVVDASQIMFEHAMINTVVVNCPAFARGVWANPNPVIGEVAKHGWDSVDNYIIEYSVKNPKALTKPIGPGLLWVVTNFEYIRRSERLNPLLRFLANRRFLHAADEAWALKDAGTEQWKAVNQIRKLAARIVLLNGTPIADSPLDLNAQFRLLDPKILGFRYLNAKFQECWSNSDTRFRDHYAVMDPNSTFPKIVGWKNLEELRDKCAPYVITKKTRECFDLPPILDPITIEAPFDEPNWKIYKQMRDEMVAWLSFPVDEQGLPIPAQASITRHAFVKSMRLAQITSGFIGGVTTVDLSEEYLDFGQPNRGESDLAPTVKEIGREKLDAFLRFFATLGSDAPERVLIWCRFRMEIERTAQALRNETGRPVYLLYGEQPQADRDEAVNALNPAIPVSEPNGVVGNPTAGGAALNLAGACMAVSLSQEAKLRVHLQARGRIDRPGQRNPITYVDVAATGPKGQRTIDHIVVAALRGKEDIATWTAATWKSKLMEE